MSEKININVDNKVFETEKGKLLIEACEDNGLEIPRFCWHKRMEPVGMCRMCLVEVETPRGKALVPSCTQEVTEGMVVDTTSEVVQKAQEGVLEFLLINHPLDCPVCDRAGECPLQDQTMAHGPGESRFIEPKRKFEKPIPISDLILLDRERCVLCDRCTRFSEEISGDPLIQFVQRGNNTQILTFPDEPFNSYFSGNTVQLCPVGALTSTSYRFKARPWDLKEFSSVCNGCSTGCSVELNTSQEKMLRILGEDNEHTNQGWICDKSRYGFEYIHSENRIVNPHIKAENEFVETNWNESLGKLVERIDRSLEFKEDSVAFIGGFLDTNEENYAMNHLFRKIIKTKNIYMSDNFSLSKKILLGDYSRAVIDDLDIADTIVLWGQDIKETLPTLFLRVKKAVKNGANLVIIGPKRTPWSELATLNIVAAPGSEMEVLNKLKSKRSKEFKLFSENIEGKSVTYLLGKSTVYQSDYCLEKFISYVSEVSEAKILPLANKSNTLGAVHMGLFDLETDLSDFIEKARERKIKTLIISGTDFLSSSIWSKELKDAMTYIEFIVSLDMFVNDTTQRTDMILPSTTFTEKDGTFTNLEGRVARQNKAVPTPGQAKSSWEIVNNILELLGEETIGESEVEINKEISNSIEGYSDATLSNLDKPSNKEGILVSQHVKFQIEDDIEEEEDEEEQNEGYSLIFYEKLYGDRAMQRNSPSISFLGSNRVIQISPKDAKPLGIEEDNNIKLIVDDESIILKANIDKTVEKGTIAIPINRRGTNHLARFTHGKIEKISEGEMLNVN